AVLTDHLRDHHHRSRRPRRHRRRRGPDHPHHDAGGDRDRSGFGRAAPAQRRSAPAVESGDQSAQHRSGARPVRARRLDAGDHGPRQGRARRTGRAVNAGRTGRTTVAAIRFGDVLAAEFIKIRTLPATWIALAVAFAANTLLGVLAVTDAVRIAGQNGTVPVAPLGTLMAPPVYARVAIAVLPAARAARAGHARAPP